MRTTLDLDDDLMREVKALAARQGTTMTAIVEGALRDVLATPPHEAFELHLPVVKGTAPPRVDVSDRQALFEVLDRVP